MTYDQALSPRLGQRTPVETTSVQMFSGGDVPEAAWPGMLIYINETQNLQIFNGNAWEDVSGGDLGQLTFVGPDVPTSQAKGDVWFNTANQNRMYVAMSVGANEIAPGEWEVMSGEPPPITATTHIYQQDTPPGPSSSPVPKDNDFWYETPNNKQYYYMAAAPNTHWVLVQDTGIPLATNLANQAIKTSVVEYAVSASETIAPLNGWGQVSPVRTPGTFIWFRTTVTRNDGSWTQTSPALLTGNAGAPGGPGPVGDPGPKGDVGVPGPNAPTVKPASSPAFNVNVLFKTLTVTTAPTELFTMLKYEVALDLAFTQITLTVDTKQTYVQLAQLPAGVPLWVRVTAYNDLGSAAPAPVAGPYQTVLIDNPDVVNMSLTMQKFRNSKHAIY